MSRQTSSGGLDTASVIKYALLAGAGYWAYTRFFSGDGAGGLSIDDLTNAIGGGMAPAPPASSNNPPAANNPPAGNPPAAVVTIAQKLIADLKAAAANDTFFKNQAGKGNAHQWNYYRNQLRPPELSPAAFGSAFPDANADTPPLYTAEEFVAKLTSANVGLGAVIIPLPMRLNVRGRDTVVWASRALPGSN